MSTLSSALAWVASAFIRTEVIRTDVIGHATTSERARRHAMRCIRLARLRRKAADDIAGIVKRMAGAEVKVKLGSRGTVRLEGTEANVRKACVALADGPRHPYYVAAQVRSQGDYAWCILARRSRSK